MEAIIVIAVVALIVLGLMFVLGRKRSEAKKGQMREKAHEYREEARVRNARADQAAAEAEERAARAKREQALADEQAAKAERERRFAHDKHTTAQEIDPDHDGRSGNGHDPVQDRAIERDRGARR